jgi:cleavage and polyadenylation specificity factor subunit 4
MAGFCPNGKECKEGAHARFPIDLKKPVVMGTETEEQGEVSDKVPEQSLEQEPVDRLETQDRAGHKFPRGKWQARGKPRGGFKRRG